LKEIKTINCSSGINPLGPSKKVKASIRKALKKINCFPEAELIRLGKLFSSKYGISNECILFGNSSEELFFFISEVLKPDKVMIAGPALSIYEEAVSSSGAEVLYLGADEKNGFFSDASEIRERTEGIDLIFIANPNRITGRLIDKKAILDIISVTTSRRVHLIIDESLREFTDEASYYPDALEVGNVTLIGTTAAFYGLPGLELAYAVSSPETIYRINKEKHFYLNVLSITAANTACKDAAYKKLSEKYIADEKRLITEVLKKISGVKTYDTDSNVFLIKLNSKSEETVARLKRSGFNIKDCSNIRGLDETFLRISVMKHESNLKFIRILSTESYID
jgi:threonine-phosphate decarboxylase